MGLEGGQQRPELTSRTTMGAYVHCPCLRSRVVTWGLRAERGLHETRLGI